MSDLDGHSAVEREVDGLEHHAHAAAAELALEAILRLQYGLQGLEQICCSRLAHGTCTSDVRVESREDGCNNARNEFDAAPPRNVALSGPSATLTPD